MITAASVQELRAKTGAGMMDCKKALLETSGNFEEAVDWLRKKGLSSAAKKAGRVAADGLTAAIVDGTVGAAIEVNSETDFVARNDQFQNLVKLISKLALKNDSIESLKSAKTDNNTTVEEEIVNQVATIGENISLRRVSRVEVEHGVVASYVHNAVVADMGKISVLVAIESKADTTLLQKLGKQIAMHIAASRPVALDISDVSEEILQRERDIFFEQSRASGKADNIIEKMVDGRIRKFYEEIVLLEQIFVIDGKTKIRDVIVNASKEFGHDIKIKAFVRFELGEGIEREVKDFATEVAAVANNS